jgi:hypothetical protein
MVLLSESSCTIALCFVKGDNVESTLFIFRTVIAERCPDMLMFKQTVDAVPDRAQNPTGLTKGRFAVGIHWPAGQCHSIGSWFMK